MPINGKPLLEFWLETLNRAGISKILVNTHHHADLVTEYIKQSPYQKHVHITFEENLLGTGGTLWHNRDYFKGDTVLVAHADNLTSFDLSAYIDRHQNRPTGTTLTMMTFKTDTPETCGIVQLDSNGVVEKFFEKVKNLPASAGNLANGAVYIVEPEIFDYLKNFKKEFIDFSTEVLPHYVKERKINTFLNNVYHRDIGNIRSFLEAQFDFPLETQKPKPWNKKVLEKFQFALSGILKDLK